MFAVAWASAALALVVQGCRFYLVTSVKTYQKMLFACLAAAAVGRALWRDCSGSVDDGLGCDGRDEFNTGTAQRADNPMTIVGLHGPTLLIWFSGYSILLLNWAQIFQLHYEKKDFQRLFLSLDGFERFSSTVVWLNAAVYGILLWVANAETPRHYLRFAGSLTGEALAFAAVLCLWLWLFLATQPRFGILSLTSHSTKLHRISSFVVMASLSLTLRVVATLLVGLDAVNDGRSLLLACDFTHILLHLVWLRQCDLSVLPLPSHTKDLTLKWLTSVLQEHGTIPGNVKVADFSGGSMPKGCHFKVSCVSVTYSHEMSDMTPKSFVVKILSWDKSIWERIQLQLRRKLDLDSLESMYLKSYQIEHRFYKHVAPHIKGLKIPAIYYNYEDCFNNKFGMVLEDLTQLEDGQPWGFNFEDSLICLRRLAQFHANNWNRKLWSSKVKKWGIGGYWTGLKREANKRSVREGWEATKKNFARDLPELTNEKYRDLGERLFSKIDWIMHRFDHMQPFTLLHGDFKISNLFVGKPKSEAARAVLSGRSESVPPPSEKPAAGIPPDDGTKLYAIDWQWLGMGSCAIDVFYFIVSSTAAPVLERQEDLVLEYFKELQRHLKPGESPYTFEHFHGDLETCFVDFCSYAIVSKWSTMTNGEADLLEYQRKCKDGMHLRTLHHVRHIIAKSDIYLKNLESRSKTA